MEIMDIFHSDAFKVVDLVDRINIAPGQPTRIGQMGLFGGVNQRGTMTPDIAVRINEKGHMIIQTAARGSDPEFNTTDPKAMRIVRAPHLPQKDAVLADELLGAYESGELEAVINDKLQDMRMNHDVTHEWHMLNALRGTVLDANGTDVVYDWYNTFNLTRKVFTYTAGGDALAPLCMQIKRWVTKSLGSAVFGGLHIFVDAYGMDKLARDVQVLKDTDRLNSSEFARTNHAYNSFTYQGVTFEEYLGDFNDATPFIAAQKGYGFPTGANIFRRYDAPAPQTSTVRRRGLPFNVTRKVMDHEAGVELKSNTNPLFMVQRPEALFEIDFA